MKSRISGVLACYAITMFGFLSPPATPCGVEPFTQPTKSFLLHAMSAGIQSDTLALCGITPGELPLVFDTLQVVQPELSTFVAARDAQAEAARTHERIAAAAKRFGDEALEAQLEASED
ncbi:MAG: hypothetical protein ACIAQF_11550, partial [Phycisphaerales bacterium JB065]